MNQGTLWPVAHMGEFAQMNAQMTQNDNRYYWMTVDATGALQPVCMTQIQLFPNGKLWYML